MSEPNAQEKALEARVAELTRVNEKLTTELDGLRNKDTELTIAGLRTDVDARDKRVNELTTQLDAAKEATASLTKRAEDAEKAAKASADELGKLRANEQKRARLATLTEKGLKDVSAAEKLVDKFASLDDAAFAETVEILSVAWKTAPQPAPTPKTSEIQAIDNATVEAEPALATAGEDAFQRDSAQAKETTDFLTNFFRTGRGREAAKSE